jgi:tRNA-uridine 2-sulfurtransferase
MAIRRKKIFVGISGGVDSSVAAFLLQREGHDVHGIFVKTWSPEWLPCTWVDEKRDAMRVCAALDIPFHFLDAEEAYKTEVAEYMISEYKAGRTPNPDVLCNRVIKFGAMWEYAKAHGATAIATGHYARTNGKALLKGIDAAKDQSYFLWMLTKHELPHISFPIGHLQKFEVRGIAERAGLFTAVKKDSQGICFLGDIDMKDFLKHYITETPGDVVTEDGTVVGRHDGVVFYTLGERHGFTTIEKSANREPYYVVRKDIDRNVLVVSHHKQSPHKGRQQTIILRDANWIEQPVIGKQYDMQVRYHGELLPVRVAADQSLVISHAGLLPLGQSAVLYYNETMLGGGIIDSVSVA